MADAPPTRSRFAVAMLLVAVVAIGGEYAALSYFWFSPTEQFAPAREVTIEKGESFRQVSRDLENAGVVRSGLALRLYGRVSLTASQIKPGGYAFKGGERISARIRHLGNGDFI